MFPSIYIFLNDVVRYCPPVHSFKQQKHSNRPLCMQGEFKQGTSYSLKSEVEVDENTPPLLVPAEGEAGHFIRRYFERLVIAIIVVRQPLLYLLLL